MKSISDPITKVAKIPATKGAKINRGGKNSKSNSQENCQDFGFQEKEEEQADLGENMSNNSGKHAKKIKAYTCVPCNKTYTE